MRRQFIRLLLSIVYMSLVILVVQCSLLFVFNRYMSTNWTNKVFDEFVQSIDDSINNINIDNSDGVFNIMINNTSERISGLIIRNGEGEFMFSLGTSPNGIPVPQLAITANRQEVMTQSIINAKLRIAGNSEISHGVEYEIKKPKYEISIQPIADDSGFGNPRFEVDLKQLKERGKVAVTYPSAISDNDIAGTIAVSINGIVAGYIDVLVYSVDFYNPTRFITREFVKSFVLTLPIMLLISIIGAYFISKRNDKAVISIQNSLSQLSRGEYDVKIDEWESNIVEYQDIKKSIEMLDSDLKRHSNSRKEWIKNISHDLNTPVTSMNILLDGACDGMFPINMDLIKMIKKENDTLASRIASVSYYSYILSPSVKFNPQVLPLMDIADSALQSSGCKCRLECSLETYIYADVDLAQRAILEVVRNACLYNSEPRNTPVVRTIERDDRTIVIVENSGKLPDPLPQFFEPWARGDASRTSGGSGLGLPIAYQIMELHKGSVSITENGGVVAVTLVFPKIG